MPATETGDRDGDRDRRPRRRQGGRRQGGRVGRRRGVGGGALAAGRPAAGVGGGQLVAGRPAAGRPAAGSWRRGGWLSRLRLRWPTSAAVAQLVAHPTCNRAVRGSSPLGGSVPCRGPCAQTPQRSRVAGPSAGPAGGRCAAVLWPRPRVRWIRAAVPATPPCADLLHVFRGMRGGKSRHIKQSGRVAVYWISESGTRRAWRWS